LTFESPFLAVPAARRELAAMQRAAVVFTYDDYLTLPNDGRRHEILDGELVMTPVPSTEHQEILLNLIELLRGFVRRESQGKVFCAPTDVVFSMTDVVQPDVVFVSKERLHIITKKNIVAAPDIVIEIVSEATEKMDRVTKKQLYERFGVKEYWLVDSEKQMIEVYELRGREFGPPHIYRASDTFRTALLSNFSFNVGSIFPK